MAAGQSLFLDAPTTGGQIIMRAGLSYTNRMDVGESGARVYNGVFAVGYTLDTNVGAYVQSPDGTGTTRSLRAGYSAYVYLDVYGNGFVNFGGSATSDNAWSAYETGGYSYLDGQNASGTVLRASGGGPLHLQNIVAGQPVYVDAGTSGGLVRIRAGGSYTESIQAGDTYVKVGPTLATNDNGYHVKLDTGNVYNGIGWTPTAAVPSRLVVGGFGTTSSSYSLMTVNSSSIAGFFVQDDNTVYFGGSSTISARMISYFDGTNAVLTSYTATPMYVISASGTSLNLNAGAGGNIYVSASGGGNAYYTAGNHFYSGYLYGAASGGITIASCYSGTAGQKLRLLGYASTGGWQEGVSVENITGSYTKVHLALAHQNVYLFGETYDANGQGIISIGTVTTAPSATSTDKVALFNNSGLLKVWANLGLHIVCGSSGYDFKFADTAGNAVLFNTSLGTDGEGVILVGEGASPSGATTGGTGFTFWCTNGNPAWLNDSGNGIEWVMSVADTSANSGMITLPDSCDKLLRINYNGTAYDIALYAPGG